MDLKEIIAPTTKELFINEIETRILSGELQAGDRLPTEREMEMKMKVSRTSINSGLAELERNGFVKIVPRKGVFVNDYMKDGNINTIVSLVNFHGGRLDSKIFKSLLEFRMNFDTEIAFLAAKNRKDEHIDDLKRITEKIKSSTNIKELAQLEFEFNRKINIATDNLIYLLFWNSFEKLMVLFNEIIYQDNFETAFIYHDELISAIKAKKPEEASNLMRKIRTIHQKAIEEKYYT